MKYAVKYRRDFRHFQDIDEVIFDYETGSDKIVEFIPQVLKKQEQRAVINIEKIEYIENIIPYLNALKEKHPNIVVQLDFFMQKDWIQILKDNDIPIMFSNFVNNYDLLYTLLKYNPTDVYIIEELGFKLKTLQFLKDAGIKVRCFPDVCQSSRGTSQEIPAIQKFWIRPEDTEEYEPYVDIFEIFNLTDQQSVVYEVYKDRLWLGDLKNLLSSADDLDLANDAIDPHFGQRRINCGKRCMIGECFYCPEVEKFAKKFKEAHFSILKDKFSEKTEVTPKEAEEILKKLKDRVNEFKSDKDAVQNE
jgi:hypothetical protein